MDGSVAVVCKERVGVGCGYLTILFEFYGFGCQRCPGDVGVGVWVPNDFI